MQGQTSGSANFLKAAEMIQNSFPATPLGLRPPERREPTRLPSKKPCRSDENTAIREKSHEPEYPSQNSANESEAQLHGLNIFLGEYRPTLQLLLSIRNLL
jgi:hypothetical protein